MMGTIKKGILGGFSGKVGNVVGASWKSIAYIRSLPSSVRNPRTRKQMSQRNRFALIGKFMKTIIPVVQVGFKNSAGAGNSAFGAAVSYNINHAVKGEYPDFGIDFAKAAVAKGSLYTTNQVTVACAAGSLTVDWDATVINNASATDRVMIIAYNPSKGEAVYDMEAATRNEAHASLALPPAWDGDEVETFMLFVSEDGALASNSIYTGSHEVTVG
ncbi:DUF6266 family protein [Proteiniphilum sp.]|uniref:DUF6266 family protein n=1 Tax=Proteiniphilum sp. TaxID=1926877 RepID=UPI002B2020DA|nr:DUF6266 family protein [Proteiniphilum sp.]MEA4918552.1 DUF6266 family protein [Proteiniphilum sp.]